MTTGSGFYVSRSGHVLTNAHVVEQCREVRIPPTGTAEIVARDDASDLALLKNDIANQPIPAIFRGGRGVQPGAAVVVIGFPLQGIISSGPSVTTGIISSLAGPSNDRRLFQMTAPIHPGSSGGPVLDDAGNGAVPLSRTVSFCG
ncbi:S1C family serine protease [Candidatus Palauibacter sp.]|uniref:S1C family serine protease n=1 Tax=Candidatus Palauibacter sp. TaxID=3101350 RepID=UPI003B517C75